MPLYLVTRAQIHNNLKLLFVVKAPTFVFFVLREADQITSFTQPVAVGLYHNPRLLAENVSAINTIGSSNYEPDERFRNADGNRKRTFPVPGQRCLPDFYTNHL